MGKGQLFSGGHPDHLFHQINACDQLGHRVFNLQTGVHFQKIEIAVAINDKFNGTCAGITHCLRQRDGLITHCLAGRFVQERRWGFLNHFLVPALDRTFTFVQIDSITMPVTQHLNFDMAGLGHEFLNKDAVITKGIRRLILGRLKPFAGFIVVPGDAHTLTAAPGRGFDHHRITDLVRYLNRLFGICDQAHITRHRRHVGLLRDLFRCNFIAHRLNRTLWGADKGDAGGL